MLRLTYSQSLKAALFATGFSGIVAEYILSTLATYFLGNSVLQWTMILSIMLFAMGIGSRVSKQFKKNLLLKFIIIEFLLSILISYCAVFAYWVSAFTSFNYDITVYFLRYDGVIIYLTSVAIGLLIGMEVPLVARINEQFEDLRINISGVLENDYYGSLIGGVFFAFIGLPIIGLKYTPFILGVINFMVSVWVLIRLKDKILKHYNTLQYTTFITLIILSVGIFISNYVFDYGEQKKYLDKVVLQQQTPYQKLVITKWKNDYWFYINGNQQLCTRDEKMYHEPMVLPAMKIHPHPKNILILGGGDGCAVREVLKFSSVESITLVDIDKKVTELARAHPIFTQMNKNALNDSKVQILHEDAFSYMAQQKQSFDILILDFPDPKTVELSRLFSLELYKNCFYALRPNGLIVAQAGSPYYATKAFYCIQNTIRSAGFYTVPLHNQIPTLGEWGWIVGAKQIDESTLTKRIQNIDLQNIKTLWLNKESLKLITSFGKPIIPIDTAKIQVNSIQNPILYQYYLKGNWDTY